MQNLQNTKNQFINNYLFEAFKTQLAKDFDQSNFPADFVEALEPDYIRIHEKIAFELQRSVEKCNSNLIQLLYRVDISEVQLKKSSHRDKTENHFDVIAELIIKRVLQKVVLTQYYKTNQNSQGNQSEHGDSAKPISGKAID